ncbi:PorT family protein [Mucilaginibacter sp. HMF5004]|uniref:porin family protein n=1 Tax=Mucilaginibacter rivuli TaxID=2857527 RepID=UPI001C5F57B8|nr:porin family protein [Mucilaginibacter rivuli]MBW4889063.1 PorT family protein [Mucilaginibacter rivuli]
MKKIAILLTLTLGTTLYASAQLIPSFQFGVKGGLNLAQISTDGSTTFSSDNRAGYNVGVYARIGALGLNLQPEVYYASKSSKVTDGAGNTNTVTFNSIDVPILLGYKFGAFGIGGRLNFGPVVSFLLTKDQSFSSALGSVATGRNYRDQDYALQFGAGLDIKKLSIDLRYEKGLNTLNSNDSNYQDKLNLFNLSLGIGF